jgi:hypothetical protein
MQICIRRQVVVAGEMIEAGILITCFFPSSDRLKLGELGREFALRDEVAGAEEENVP